MTEPNKFKGDPFFELIHDAEWNACIGRQSDEENYLDGYIEAAIELIEAIFAKRLMGSRDTLVLPILYNARHAIELTLKFATTHLIKAGVFNGDGAGPHHHIEKYWTQLDKAEIGDALLSATIKGLKPFVDSLSQIDTDGQELRYHRNRDDEQSLEGYALANLRLIRENLKILKRLLFDLKNRTIDYIDECRTKTFTGRCSRRDLFEIAQMIPERAKWNTDDFDVQKAVVRERFGLSGNGFSDALRLLQEVRETKSILGLESELLHISDDEIFWAVEQWRRWHPKSAQNGLAIVNAADIDADEILKHSKIEAEVVSAVKDRLSREKLADLEAIFYLERNRSFSEYYETDVARTIKQHQVANEPNAKIYHLFEKTNFLDCVRGAVVKLGRLKLAERLKEI